MLTSDAVNDIAAALSKAQAAMKQPIKDRTVTVRSDKGSYEFAYATLDSVIDAARVPLTENGLSFVQATDLVEGRLMLETTILHASGQWIRSSLPVPGKSDAMPQQLGSAISYARRYALSSLLGIVASEDDDANIAEGNDMKSRRGAAKGREREQGSAPVERPRQNIAANKAAVEAWRALNRTLASSGCTVLTQDHPNYTDFRMWLRSKLESALNMPVPVFTELTAEQVSTARETIATWFAAGELKPWTPESATKEN